MSNQLAVIPIVMKYKLSRRDQVRFQLLVYFHFRGIKLTANELECLTLLVIEGTQRISLFCNRMVSEGVSQTIQSARNTLTKLTNMGLLVKGTNKSSRTVRTAIDTHILTGGNTLVNIQCLCTDEPS